MIGYITEDTINLFDTDTNTMLRQINHNATIILKFSPDGLKFLSGSSNGQVKLFDTYTGEELGNFKINGAVTFLNFNSDGSKFIIGAYNLKVYDTYKLTILMEKEAEDYFSSGCFNNADDKIICGDFYRCKIFDLNTSELLNTIELMSILNVFFMPDDKNFYIITNNTLHFYNSETYEEEFRFSPGFIMRKIFISADGSSLLCSCDSEIFSKKIIRIIDLNNKEVIFELEIFSSSNSLCFNSDSTKIMFCNNNVKILDLETNTYSFESRYKFTYCAEFQPQIIGSYM